MLDNYWTKLQRSRMTRRRVLHLAAGGAAAAALAACGDSGDDTDDATTEPTTTGAAAGTGTSNEDLPLAESQTLVNRFRNDLLTLDPAVIFGVEQEATAAAVYNGLTRFNVDTDLEADLAQGWETSPDGLIWTFKLHPATWQKDYGDVTAEDVVYSYNRVIEGGGPYAWEFDLVDTITSPDASTVEIKLSKPYPNFLFVVANYHQGQIINRVAFETLGDTLWFEPVGTGPFIVSAMGAGEGFMFTRHEQYFKGPATVPSMEFRRIDSTDTAAIALQAGEIDTFMYVNEVVYDRLASDPNITISQAQSAYPQLWMLNTSIPSLADPRIRQAINHAIDWETLVASSAPNTSAAANSIVPDWVPDYSADIPVYSFDAQKATDLLAAAGLTDVGFKFLVNSSPSESQLLTQSYLSDVGVNLEYEIVDRAAFNGRRVSGAFEVTSRGLPAAFIEEIMFNYLHPDNAVPNGFNAVQYDNPTLTAKMEEARSEMDAARRTALWAEVQNTVMTDLPYIPATFSHQTWACRSDISGFKVNHMASADWYPLKRVQK